MSQGRGPRRSSGHHKNKINIGDKGREVLANINESSPLVQQFRAYAAELDDKHDRFERITKISRDVTIESKRIIFLLHSIDNEAKRESVSKEARQRFESVENYLFKTIARELEGQDVYQYLRAYRAGLEEYIEAVTFYQFLQNGTMEDWQVLQKSLSYSIVDDENEERTLCTLITPHDYILGIADLTGELMRMCINNLAAGDITSCYQTCNFVRNIYRGFLGCTNKFNKEMNRKLYVLRGSMHKMESVCYTIKVRGSEIPNHILMDVAIEASEEQNKDYEAY